mmetsp:Transcript_753/g.2447  ORF Transcript_753/g.2447 Transcript_753/m.2447 type:complete len:310 (-) Transcript_753:230-1159(-)|eukprot:CAMPEP_0198730152 /NCGR_PEP_ID=MMETSP1475-20131203/23084_1 /TAXON_ID= ORGANISM="Unidentified sp., Strain CCMP1999" /NCGR_SAMPLE_ID=MMETSP1475 /ASSEMBLY_ACC=CAM_ASM_001111 /LENGTH=309 /DNA_ID=CAMNT_0044492923 /DNA_START=32 /DNA_END=961 /DNA_ORIENTATION=-
MTRTAAFLVQVSPLAVRHSRCKVARRQVVRAAAIHKPEDVLPAVIEAAEKAAAHMMAKVGAGVQKTKVNSRDLLTEVDPECQQIIHDCVREKFPDHGLLGEESVASGRDASEKALEESLQEHKWLWIVDPIDGTTNFVHNQPMSAVSIGVAHSEEVVIGVIVDPYRGETFAAVKGGGATLNGQPIRVSQEQTAEEALVAVGSPSASDSLDAALRGIVMMMPKVRSMRMLGSAAIMYAWVACGRITAYWEPDLHSWDSAGGAILVKEAGGRIGDFFGEDYNVRTRKLLASNTWTHEELRKILLQAEVHNL